MDNTNPDLLFKNSRRFTIYRSPEVNLSPTKDRDSRLIKEFLKALDKGGFRVVSEEDVDPKVLKQEREEKMRQEHPTCFLTEEQREGIARSFREKFKEELEELAALKEEIRRKRTQEQKVGSTLIEEMLEDLRNHVYLSYAKSMREYMDYCQETASPEELSDICTLISQRLSQLDSMPVEEIIRQSKAYQAALQERKARFKPTEP